MRIKRVSTIALILLCSIGRLDASSPNPKQIFEAPVEIPQLANFALIGDGQQNTIAMWDRTSPTIHLINPFNSNVEMISMGNAMEVESVFGSPDNVNCLVSNPGTDDRHYYYFNENTNSSFSRFDVGSGVGLFVNNGLSNLYISCLEPAKFKTDSYSMCNWLRVAEIAYDDYSSGFEAEAGFYLDCPELEDLKVISHSGGYVVVGGHIPRAGSGFRVVSVTSSPLELTWVTPVYQGCANGILSSDNKSFIVYGATECGDNPATSSALLLHFSSEGELSPGFGTATDDSISSVVLSQNLEHDAPERSAFTHATFDSAGRIVLVGYSANSNQKNIIISRFDQDGEFLPPKLNLDRPETGGLYYEVTFISPLSADRLLIGGTKVLGDDYTAFLEILTIE